LNGIKSLRAEKHALNKTAGNIKAAHSQGPLFSKSSGAFEEGLRTERRKR